MESNEMQRKEKKMDRKEKKPKTQKQTKKHESEFPLLRFLLLSDQVQVFLLLLFFQFV